MHTPRWILTIFLVLALLAGLASPAYAQGEVPPPPGDPGGGGSPVVEKSAPAEPRQAPDEATEAAASSDVVRPPAALPDAVAPAHSAAYTADDNLVSDSGNPEVSALFGPPITACPPGVVPTWWGGTGLGCVSTGTLDITTAIAVPAVITGWSVFVPSGSANADPVNINKSINVIGDIAADTYIDNLVTFMKGNALLSDFTIRAGGVTASAGLTGYTRLQNLNILTPGLTGINISGHKGNVELTNVISSGNLNGAYIDNSAGIGYVTVNNSQFSYNTGGAQGYGLFVISKGAVKLDNVVASNNQGDGGVFSFGTGLTIRNGQFNHNANADINDYYGFGIYAFQTPDTSGAVAFNNVSANDNDAGGVSILAGKGVTWNTGTADTNLGSTSGNGVYIESTTGAVVLNSVDAGNNAVGGVLIDKAPAGATITNSLFIHNLGGNGLDVAKAGNVVIKYVFASTNAGHGILVTNDQVLGKTVNISFITLSDNADDGLNVRSRGAVTLNTINSRNNGDSGVDVDNCLTVGVLCTGSGGVTLLKATDQQNSIDNNGDYGLIISSKGPVTLTGLLVNRSPLGGIFIDTCNVSGTTGKCLSSGAVTLTDVQSYGSGAATALVRAGGNIAVSVGKFGWGTGAGSGAEFYTHQATTPRSITIKYGLFNSNPSGDGLTANAGSAALNLTDIDASFNLGGRGAVLSGGSVSISTSVWGTSLFKNNNTNGLTISASGAVTLRNIDASNNAHGNGASIGTFGTPVGGAVSITNALFNNNSDPATAGLMLYARGAVSLTNVTVKDNGNMGANLKNDYNLVSAVTIKSSYFDSASASGLSVFSKGIITLDSVSAFTSAPSAYGAYLYNRDGTAGINVLASAGRNYFRGGTAPGYAGLSIMSKGAVSVKNTNATNGLYVEGGTGATLTDINSVTFGPRDIYVMSGGNILLTRVYSAGGTLSEGTFLYNAGAATPKTVTVTGGNFASAGHGSGLTIQSKGAVSLTNVTAGANHFMGAFVDNSLGTTAAPVTIAASGFYSNLNNASPSGQVGLYVKSKGTITLKTVNAWDNLQNGIQLDNCLFDGATCANPLAANVVITNTYGNNSLVRNGLSNLLIMPKGSVSITGLESIYAGTGHGISIVSQYGSGDVTLNSIIASFNAASGAYITTRGRVSANNVEANYNTAGYGFYINNMFNPTAGAKPVSVTNGIFNQNGSTGLVISSHAAVTLNHITADANDWSGVDVNNCDWNGTQCLGSGDVNLLATLGPNQITNNIGLAAARAGLAINTNGNVNIFKTVISSNGFNGTPTLGSGVSINLLGNHTATFTCSQVIYNALYGIDAMLMGAGAPVLQLKSTLVLRNLGGNFDLTGVTQKNLWGFCAY